MKKNQFSLALPIALLIIAMTGISCKSTQGMNNTVEGKIRSFAGTTWKMSQTVEGLDAAPTITWNHTLKFLDKKNVEWVEENEYGSYSGTYKRDDGNVDYHPGFTKTETKKGTYSVKGKEVKVKIEEEEEDMVFNYNGEVLIYKLGEDEYKALREFERDYYTYKRIK